MMFQQRPQLQSFFCLPAALLVAACSQPDYEACELRYDGWGVDAGWYPPRADGPGRLEEPWLYNAAFAGSQDEPGNQMQSEFKLLKLVIVDSAGTRLPISDCVQIRARAIRVETTWDTGDLEPSISIAPTNVTFKFIDSETGRDLKTIVYPLPQNGDLRPGPVETVE